MFVKFILLILAYPVYVDARCPVGAIQGLQPGHCYVRRTSAVSWFTAEENCQKLGGHLASVANGFQNSFLLDSWDGLLQGYYYWLGASTQATTSNNWAWTDGTPFGYTNWKKGQPNVEGGHCLMMDARTGEWSTNPCTDTIYYVCNVPPVTDSISPTSSPPRCRTCCPSGWTLFDVTGMCYKLVYDLRWNDAFAACQTINATLASIHSEEENNWLAAFAATNLDIWSRVWFGLNDLRQTGTFEFTDGTKLTYTNWGPARPQTGSETDCVYFHTDAPPGGEDWYLKWTNGLCDYHSPYVYAAICQLRL